MLTTDDAVLVKIQNVRDYYIEHWKEHTWDQIRSFTCVKLPFPKILFAYDHGFKNPETGGVTLRHVNVGVAKCSVENFLLKASEDKVDLGDTIHVIHTLEPDSVIEARMAVDGRSLPGQWHVFIDKMGKVLTNEEQHLGWIWTRDPTDTKLLQRLIRMDGRYEDTEWLEEFESSICRHGSIALAAVQFMNCKNVEVLDNPPSRQQRRAAERERKPVPATYKTLLIHPLGKPRRVVRQGAGEVVAGVSLHICRGHFKDFRVGPGLGRAHVHGVWWWSPMVRGTSERGTVVKDYAIEVETE